MNFIFDLDDTLVQRDTIIPLPNRLEVLETISNNNNRIYIATNQSGPAWRIYSENLRKKDYKKYPIFEFSMLRLGYLTKLFNVNYCLAALIPGNEFVAKAIRNELQCPEEIRSLLNGKILLSYRLDWRKPKGGMLDFIMDENNLNREDCLFVGDLPSDEQAAKNAGIAFQHAKEFFYD